MRRRGALARGIIRYPIYRVHAVLITGELVKGRNNCYNQLEAEQTAYENMRYSNVVIRSWVVRYYPTVVRHSTN